MAATSKAARCSGFNDVSIHGDALPAGEDAFGLLSLLPPHPPNRTVSPAARQAPDFLIEIPMSHSCVFADDRSICFAVLIYVVASTPPVCSDALPRNGLAPANRSRDGPARCSRCVQFASGRDIASRAALAAPHDTPVQLGHFGKTFIQE
ncbi:hypothetical protein [Burkholderia sp. Bp9012]|uniref:hypothetical protein n=1 Tax=Burkholderia sp. Bp9012 TaxID=2184562 RepID=UPI0021AB60F6|nr:hypothetical protein [Burkholderia sp. Bp9012]